MNDLDALIAQARQQGWTVENAGLDISCSARRIEPTRSSSPTCAASYDGLACA